LPTPSWQSAGESVWKLESPDGYTESFLQLPKVFELLPAKGIPLAMIPNRGVLLATGADESGGIAALLEAAKKSLQEIPWPLCGDLFRITSSGVELYVPDGLEAHHPHSSQPTLNELHLPKRNPLRAVGIDGGYVKASDAPSRQEGWFEVMVGKSLPRAGSGQVFAFVHRLEPKPNERMERFLAEQGVFPAQPTTFLSDGGETVRQAQGEFREFGEPILDWFHVAMRTTQLTQSIKGLAADPPIEGDSPNRIEELLRELNRAKAYLWHGSPHRALRTVEDLTWEIGTESPRAKALQDKFEEFMNYITANMAAIPNYADRHRHGEPIATGFVESAVN
jgi:hypothetical protein